MVFHLFHPADTIKLLHVLLPLSRSLKEKESVYFAASPFSYQGIVVSLRLRAARAQALLPTLTQQVTYALCASVSSSMKWDDSTAYHTTLNAYHIINCNMCKTQGEQTLSEPGALIFPGNWICPQRTQRAFPSVPLLPSSLKHSFLSLHSNDLWSPSPTIFFSDS